MRMGAATMAIIQERVNCKGCAVLFFPRIIRVAIRNQGISLAGNTTC